MIAMLNDTLHDKLSDLADKLLGLDVEVAEAVVTAENDLAAGLKRMEALHLDVSTLDRHFRGTVANLLRYSSSGERRAIVTES